MGKGRSPIVQGQEGEEAVARWWEVVASHRQPLVTTMGEPIRVLFAGRRNRGPGPDFRDVVLSSRSGRMVTGDVEVHVRPGEWTAHGHGDDPTYNDLVLHVVLRGGGTTATPLELGIQVPVLALEDQGDLAVPAAGAPPLPCVGCGQRLGAAAVTEALAEAGEARFLGRSLRLQREMNFTTPQEVLYRGLMEALGYSANRAPFRKLALLLPYAEVHRLWHALAPPQRLPRLGVLLLEAAGWTELATYPPEAPPKGSSTTGAGQALLQPGEWRLSGLRPANHPVRRLRGMAVLLHRTAPMGLVSALRRALAQGRVRALEAALTVVEEGRGSLIGRDRARDMAVNVVLPFFHALGSSQSPQELATQALDLYRAFPPLQANHLSRALEARFFRGGERPRLGARELQGMLHLHKERCTFLRCAGCPLAAGLSP